MAASSTAPARPSGSIDDAGRQAGIVQLRPEQTRCVESLLDGRDVLAVIPTGGGKSAIYQVAATLMAGPTVVVTPLLSLMDDQHRSINDSDLPPAVSINGSSTGGDRTEALELLAAGTAEYCFVTPETLDDNDLVDRLNDTGVSLLVVDEAHCVVTWGHSFRPDYLGLGDVRRRLGSPVCVALTASADQRIRADLVRLLSLSDPLVHVDDLRRENIELEVRSMPDRASARAALLEHLETGDDKTVVYAPTRAECEAIAGEARNAGRTAAALHGGHSPDERSARAEAFRTTPGSVIVATTAFGMGVDIPDVRTVAHMDFPPTLIDYYQEIGRAGRDGKRARAIAFVGRRRRSRRSFASGVRPVTVDDCAGVLSALNSGARSRKELASRTSIGTGRVARALAVLEQSGAVQTRPRLRVLDPGIEQGTIEALCLEREAFDRSQRSAVDRFLTSTDCRWTQILAALGEACGPCGTCDNCKATPKAGHHLEGRRVTHATFGPGVVTAVDDGDVSISFDRIGPRSLDLAICLEQQLLDIE